MTDPSVIPLLVSTLDNTAPIAGLDTETYYDKVCSVKELGAWAYARHLDWDCYLLTVARKSKEGIRLPTYIGPPELFPWKELHGYRIYSHNAGFDMTMYRRLVEQGKVPDIEPHIEGWDCTADFGAYYCNRRSLADVVLFVFGRHLSKAARDDAKGKRWPGDFSADEQETMLKYGGNDADECLNIGELAQTKWPAPERLLSRLTRLQSMRGVRIDVTKLHIFLAAARQRLIEINRDIPWIAEGFAPTSPKAFAQYCRDKGIPIPPVKAQEGEDAYLAWEAEYGGMREMDGTPVFPPIKAVVDHRCLNKVITTLETLKERTGEDGIFRFGMKYGGAHTLRFSGDSGLNMQALLKSDANDPDAFWITVNDALEILSVGNIVPGSDSNFDTYKAKNKKLGVDFETNGIRYLLLDVRSLFIAREGFMFAIADSAQIEPRCLAQFTKDAPFMKLVRDGYDIYESHARLMHGFTGPKGHLKVLANDMKDPKAMQLRARCKGERIGLGYQAGPKGYMKAAAIIAGLRLSFDEALAAVKQYREASPHVVGFWKKLQAALDSHMGKTLRLKLPSGRLMSYRNLMRERKLGKDDDGNPVWREHITAETDGKRGSFYPGRLTENLCQAMARDVFCEQLLIIWERSFARVYSPLKSTWECIMESLEEAPLWSVHDEAVVEVRIQEARTRLEEILEVMNTSPTWASDCPFGSEGSLSPFYLK
jgi:hypothetical protein